jgi:hypothetical protein
LDKIIVQNEKTTETYYFNCGKWLAKDIDDKQIVRELVAAKEGVDPPPLTQYKITTITG